MDLVTMGEAAQRLGVSVDTIRRRLRRGELEGQHQPTPQGFIWLIEMPNPALPVPKIPKARSLARRPDPGIKRIERYRQAMGSNPAGNRPWQEGQRCLPTGPEDSGRKEAIRSR